MGLIMHTLGSLNLLTDYCVVAEGDGGWDPKVDEKLMPFGASDGARLAHRRQAETVRELAVICTNAVGALATYAQSKAKADAIDAELIAAANYPNTGTLITYAEQDASEVSPDTWKVIGGVFKRLPDLRGTGLIKGQLTLKLSKN